MAVRKPRILSARVMAEAQRHLIQSCNVMARLVAAHGSCPLAKRKFHPFHTLVTSIISQQLSARVANSIESRVLKVVPTFCPSGFLATPLEALRGAGLSMTKVKYINELAARVADGRLNFGALMNLRDEEVIVALTELPGVGRWTAEMFLIFGLKRPDVLAMGDAGLQRAVRMLYGEGATLENIGQTWKPYCSVASWYLWRHLDSPEPVP
ncbi:MAG: DNA-3-methyladenine glycosylase 2 family protein [Pseudomonadota bacterium]